MFRITVFSDYICPFCYIGSAILDALAQEYDLEVRWSGLEIHPETPPEGSDLHRLFGREQFEGMQVSLKAMAHRYGIPYNPSSRMPNSRKALEAAEFARDAGRFQEFHRILMRASFVQQLDIGSIEVLKALAAEAGLDPSALETALTDGRYSTRREADAALARRLNVRSTPTFIINDTVTIVGAQPPERFREVLANLPDA